MVLGDVDRATEHESLNPALDLEEQEGTVLRILRVEQQQEAPHRRRAVGDGALDGAAPVVNYSKHHLNI